MGWLWGGAHTTLSETRSSIPYPLFPFLSYSCAFLCSFLHLARAQVFFSHRIPHSSTKNRGCRAPLRIRQRHSLRQPGIERRSLETSHESPDTSSGIMFAGTHAD